ncbi:MAG: ABC transporter permease [Bryobacteraceae bacterium]|jgi:predicted permease
MARFSSLVQNLFRKDSVEQELDEEVRAYLNLLAEEKIKAGMSPEAAYREAAIELGGVEQVKEQVREVRIGSLLESVAQDARFGLRTLAKSPGFTAVAVLSLALGIGGNAGMFSIVYGVLMRPLPYPEPDRLVRVTGYYPQGAVVALEQRSRAMDVAAHTTDSEFNLTGQGEALRLLGSAVSANLFTVLGARTEMGRTFQPGEDQPGRDRIVILSHALWQNRFASDPRIIGRPIAIDGLSREVIGVMPPGFSFPSSGVRLWIPLHLDPSNSLDFWGAGYMPLVARLRPRATLEQAQNEIRPLISQVIPLFPFVMARNWNADATVLPLQQDLVSDVSGRLLVLLSAVGLVLLIACANVASLLLARSAGRRKEIALRASLGASSGRIARQLLTESVVLAMAGGGLGLALAYGALSVLKSALPATTPRLAEAGIDWRVVAFASALAVLTGLAFGVAPALSAARLNVAEAIRSGGRRATGTVSIRLRSSLIAGEVALAVVLVIGAGLLIKSLWLLTQVDPGFRPERIVTVRVSPSQSFCQERARCVALYDELLRRARGISGVSDVAATNVLPLSGEVPGVPSELEGHPIVPAENLAPALWTGAVTPDYFRVLRIPLLAGRVFTDADTATSSAVVVVSAATAQRYWPRQNPIGKHLRPVWDKEWRMVVGVVADVRQYDLAGRSPTWTNGTMYMPYPQSVGLNRQMPSTMNLLLRTAADPVRVAGEISGLVAGVNPDVPAGEIRTMDAVVTASTAQSRSMMWLFVSFAGTALILAVVGTYGVVSYSTAQRTYEMGVRVALGATKGGIFGLVLGQSLRLVLAGLALGVLASLALTRMLARFLYGITPTDPMTFLAVSGLLAAIGILAGYFPARRAAGVDPLTALRAE